MDFPSIDKIWGWVAGLFGVACTVIWKLFSRRVDALETNHSVLTTALQKSETNALLYFASKATISEIKAEWRADLDLIRNDHKENHRENTQSIATMNSSIGELRSLIFQVLSEVSKHATK